MQLLITGATVAVTIAILAGAWLDKLDKRDIDGDKKP